MVELDIDKLKELIDKVDATLTELKRYIGEEQVKRTMASMDALEKMLEGKR